MISLKNRYYAVRHGESLANVAGIIVSDPAVGTRGYGLSTDGRAQVRNSIQLSSGLDESTLIISSDFLRTAETAEIIREALGVDSVRFDIRLRERFFGKWDGASYVNYSTAWHNDAVNPELVLDGVEGTGAVGRRMLDVIHGLDREVENRDILLVSHGDPLLVLQAVLSEIPAARHRTLRGFGTAEIRPLN